jgi:demethylmenaquinone methyltransferase/2-methoxy-6-polyprenyl-1,4-benzoquinol methylase
LPISKSYPSIKDLSEEQRVQIVKRIFSSVTDHYDFLNHFLSAGRDKAWRRFLIQRLNFFSTHRLLDLATGTGDVAIDAARHHPHIRVIGLDFAKPMMDVAAAKIDPSGLSGRISLIKGDAMNLPFSGGSFDALTVAFGIRNMPDRRRVLEEMVRVLLPGGKVFLLELTVPKTKWFRMFYVPYLKHIIPRLSRWFSKNPAAYLYLAESILQFPSPEEMAKEMEQIGLVDVRNFPLSLGITCLHEGSKPQ